MAFFTKAHGRNFASERDYGVGTTALSPSPTNKGELIRLSLLTLRRRLDET